MNLEELNYALNMQNNNLKILLECLKNINFVIQDTDNFENPKELVNLLKDTKTNLDNTRNNISNLETLKKHSNDLNNSETSNLNDYNELSKAYTEIINTTNLGLNKFLLKYIKNTTFSAGKKTESLSTLPNEEKKASNTDFTTCTTPHIETTEITDDITLKPLEETTKTKNANNENETLETVAETKKQETTDKQTHIEDNVLLISEKRNRIVLPYTIEELNTILNTNKSYTSFQEIIDDKYTLPLNKYKNTTISRFKETYNLMRKKEKASIVDSLDLALELTFNNKLNPAIITACKNLDQLDTYLDCLELDKLNEFNYFEVKYEFLPMTK